MEKRLKLSPFRLQWIVQKRLTFNTANQNSKRRFSSPIKAERAFAFGDKIVNLCFGWYRNERRISWGRSTFHYIILSSWQVSYCASTWIVSRSPCSSMSITGIQGQLLEVTGTKPFAPFSLFWFSRSGKITFFFSIHSFFLSFVCFCSRSSRWMHQVEGYWMDFQTGPLCLSWIC